VGFSPEEIEVKDFLIGLRGYDREEVRSFLRAVAADYRRVLAMVRDPESTPIESHDTFQTVASEVAEVLRSVATMRERSEFEVSQLDRQAKDVLGRAVSALEAVRGAQQEAEKTIQRWMSSLNALLQQTASERTQLQGLGHELVRQIAEAEKSIEDGRRRLVAGPAADEAAQLIAESAADQAEQQTAKQSEPRAKALEAEPAGPEQLRS
jgi:DivIVA domain-containing protein